MGKPLVLDFFGELYSLVKCFWPIFEGVWVGFRERDGSIFSNHQHFANSTGIYGVACPLFPLGVDKPFGDAIKVYTVASMLNWFG